MVRETDCIGWISLSPKVAPPPWKRTVWRNLYDCRHFHWWPPHCPIDHNENKPITIQNARQPVNLFRLYTISFVISNAFTGVNLIVRPLRQLLSVGWVISSFPSTAKCTFSWFQSSKSIAILRNFILTMSFSRDVLNVGFDDRRRHNFVEISFASRFIRFKWHSIISWASFKRSLLSKCVGVTLYSRASSNGYLVTLWTGTCYKTQSSIN